MADKDTSATAKPPVTPEVKPEPNIIDLSESVVVLMLDSVGIAGTQVQKDSLVRVPKAVAASLVRASNAERWID